MSKLSSQTKRLRAVRAKAVKTVPAVVDRVLPRDADGLTARDRAESLDRANRVYGTLPTSAQVARSKADARRRASERRGLSC
jgi:hypothetical protein